MKVEDAERIVGMLGERLVREKDAKKNLTALCVVIADLHGWAAASDFAGLLGLEGDQQEHIYRSWKKDA
jgi:hypothetical protein